jgi:hypothetical protein
MNVEAFILAAAKEIESAWEERLAAEEARPRRRPRFHAHCLENLRMVRRLRRNLEREKARRARSLRRPGKGQ